MDKICLQFSTTPVWQSGVIRLLTHSPYSHVDVVVTQEDIGPLEDVGPAFTCPTPYGLLGVSDPGGVMIRDPNYHVFKTRRRVIMTTDKADLFLKRMLSQVGRPFDDEALYRVVDLNFREWKRRDRWFCSELVTWALEDAGFFPYKLVIPKNRVTPADLLLLLNPYINPMDLDTEVTS